jgi:hypothetical protein
MAKSVEALSSEYETALAAHQDDPDDQRKRAAADKAATRLNQAREQSRQGRTGVGVATTDNDGEE